MEVGTKQAQPSYSTDVTTAAAPTTDRSNAQWHQSTATNQKKIFVTTSAETTSGNAKTANQRDVMHTTQAAAAALDPNDLHRADATEDIYVEIDFNVLRPVTSPIANVTAIFSEVPLYEKVWSQKCGLTHTLAPSPDRIKRPIKAMG